MSAASSQRQPITRADLLVDIGPRSVTVSARAYSPYRWPAVRDVRLVFFSYSPDEAVELYLDEVARTGWYRDSLAS